MNNHSSTYLEQFLAGRNNPHNPLALRHHFRLRSRPKPRALLCLPKQGHVYDAAKWACDRLGIDVCGAAVAEAGGDGSNAASSSATATADVGDAVKLQRPNIIVVDARSSANVEAAEAVARCALRNDFRWGRRDPQIAFPTLAGP